MREALRRAAMAIVVLLLAAVFGCAARGRGVAPGNAEATAATATVSTDSATPAAPSTASAAAQIREAAFNEDSDGARVVLSANAPLLYTAYEPRPDVLVVELPGAGLSDQFVPPAASGSLVQSLRVEPISEMGKQFTRLTVTHRDGLRYDVRSVGQGLAISFEPAQGPAVAQGGAPVPSPTAPGGPAVVAAERVAPPSPARGELAHALEEIRAIPGQDQVTVALLADGVLRPKDSVLGNPPRIVIDLPGVKNDVRRRALNVKSALVSRVRVSQFQTAPNPVTRVVLDLARPSPHRLRFDGEQVAIVVGASEAVLARPEPASSTTVSETGPRPAPETKSTADGANLGPQPLTAASSSPAAAVLVPEKGSAKPPSETKLAETATPAATPVREEVNSALPPPARASSSSPAKLPPGVRQARRGSSVASSRPAQPRSSAREEALFEAAAAVLEQQEETARPETSATFQPRIIAESQSQFTGEPISLDLKDADIKDVFRTISQLTQLNIVVDPEVRGTVTVQLENVPWDQALDLILKQNSLGYVLENNIMRIATTAKLSAEQTDRTRLAEARQSAEPTRTVLKKLSYASAGEITASIRSVMSKRGDIVVDGRTNTLIIREIPTFMPAVLQLIENLDTATPQVIIEARIVETTKTLGRSLGISWGLGGAADVAHGNTTGLLFPNNVTGTFNVGLGAGTTVTQLHLGNILDTLSLDVALTAAENQGLLKIISSPKVTALTNTPATIQSGVQIPVQTTVNNTTTVIYVDATLQLQVTPQITNEGTIMLSVNVQKREPAQGLNLSTGPNVPLTIRQYRGQVLVRDGGTAVIGGIFQINDQDQNNMIPGLWKIPILGNLFRNRTRSEKHDELLIFITPRIVRS